MTPRSVIFALNSDLTVGQVLEEHDTLDFTRIPIYSTDLDAIDGMVNRYEIINRKADDQFSTRMHEISQEVPMINENDSIDKVLELLFFQKLVYNARALHFLSIDFLKNYRLSY